MTVHDFIQKYIDELQPLLNEHADDDALQAAMQEKWANEKDPRHALFFSVRRWLSEEEQRLKSEGGDASGSDRPNEPTPKTL